MTHQKRRKIVKTRRTGIGLIFVMAISMVAGMSDAIGLMMAGDFVSFMSGNTTRAAIALGSGDFDHVRILLLAILDFIIGNAAGVLIARPFRKRILVVLSCVAAILAIAALFPSASQGSLAFYLVVLAMGMVNATVENVEGLPIGLTYVTGALSRFGRGIGRWIAGDRNYDWPIQIVPWLGMFLGAVIGSICAIHLQAQALWVAAGAAFLVAMASVLIPRPLQNRLASSRSPNAKPIKMVNRASHPGEGQRETVPRA